MNFLSYFAVKYVQQLDEISKSSRYCLGYIFKGQKVLNDRMKLENNKAMPSWKFSTQEGLTLEATLNYQMPKKQKRNKPAYQRPITVLFFLQVLLLVKLLSLFFSAEWWGVVNRWPIDITLFSPHLLFIHFILSYPV